MTLYYGRTLQVVNLFENVKVLRGFEAMIKKLLLVKHFKEPITKNHNRHIMDVLPDTSFKLPEKWECTHFHTTMDLTIGQLLSMTRNTMIMSNIGVSLPKCLIFIPGFNE